MLISYQKQTLGDAVVLVVMTARSGRRFIS